MATPHAVPLLCIARSRAVQGVRQGPDRDPDATAGSRRGTVASAWHLGMAAQPDGPPGGAPGGDPAPEADR